MSVHASYRLKRSYQAMLVAFFALSSTHSFALTLGSPTIQSEQHEPLSATIPVSNINADEFSASIASAGVYQQMGMTATANVQVRFVKTSDTAGKLILTSSSPVSTPFADVVLNLSDGGQSHLKPQTLLLPISTKGVNPATTLAATDTQPELPLISGHPLTVTNDAPPPLFPSTADDSTGDDTLQAKHISTPAPADTNAQPVSKPSLDTHALNTHTNENTDTQLQVLTKQVTTQVIGVVAADGNVVATAPTPASSDTTTATQQKPERPVDEIPSTDGETASYVVQSGDSLWKIAEQIAKANNLSVQVVMDALHKQNPHAFNNGNINQLKAAASLSIPNYDVIPSQKAIQEAIAVRKSISNKKARPAEQAKTKTPSTPARPTQAQAAQTGKTTTTVKPLPKPQVTLVTPSKSGQATGTSQQAGTSDSNPLVSSLKDTRAQVAKKAKKVNNLNQALSSATQKLQLQNQKLAELEARLKELKDK